MRHGNPLIVLSADFPLNPNESNTKSIGRIGRMRPISYSNPDVFKQSFFLRAPVSRAIPKSRRGHSFPEAAVLDEVGFQATDLAIQ